LLDLDSPQFQEKPLSFMRSYAAVEPSRDEIEALGEPAVLEFGAAWCGICQAAQADIAAALEPQNDLRHIKIEDAKGRPLGRSFGVKLWPTLVFLQQGREVGRVVRPQSRQDIETAMAALTGG
jgi:thioredoxin 1